MNTLQTPWKQKELLLWTLIGPLFLIFSLSLLLLKSVVAVSYFPAFTILGLVLSCCWQWRGFTLALLSVGAVYSYRFGILSSDHPLFEAGIWLSIVLGFAITVLSLQEVSHAIQKVIINYESNKTSEREALDAKEKALQMLTSAQEELRAIHTELENTTDKVRILQNSELENKKKLNETSSQLSTSSSQLSTISSQLSAASSKLSAASSQSAQDRKDIVHLTKLVESSKRNTSLLETKIQKLEAEAASHLKTIKEKQVAGELLQEQFVQFVQQIAQQNNKIEELKQMIDSLLQENTRLKETLENSPTLDSIVSIEAEKKALWQKMRNAEGLYYQLREQFEDKSSLLDQVRRELFLTQEELLKLNFEIREKQIFDDTEAKEWINYIVEVEHYYQEQLNKDK